MRLRARCARATRKDDPARRDVASPAQFPARTRTIPRCASPFTFRPLTGSRGLARCAATTLTRGREGSHTTTTTRRTVTRVAA